MSQHDHNNSGPSRVNGYLDAARGPFGGSLQNNTGSTDLTNGMTNHNNHFRSQIPGGSDGGRGGFNGAFNQLARGLGGGGGSRDGPSYQQDGGKGAVNISEGPAIAALAALAGGFGGNGFHM